MADIDRQFVHLARLAIENRQEDIIMLVRKTLTGLAKRRPDLETDVSDLLSRVSNNNTIRSVAETLPVDLESRLELLRCDYSPSVDVEPVWPTSVGSLLNEFICERSSDSALYETGIEPTKSLLFKGLPGTGKTLAAHWLSKQLNYPLFTLDLSAVMSSFLGRTGNNIRIVLDYARHSQVVLLLDEFDAIAKRRDDDLEIGELKRLVTVILQEIESWPSHSLLIAATNHPDLLDPAVWRRFDRVIEFPLPTKNELEKLITNLVPPEHINDIPVPLLAELLFETSFADVTRTINTAKRSSLVRHIPFIQSLIELSSENYRDKTKKEKLTIAAIMKNYGLSQRQIATLTGLSRDTLRSHLTSTPPQAVQTET